jgi:hypothetical protein
MKIKSTVRLPEINQYGSFFFYAVTDCEKALKFEHTLTSGNDGEHSPNSLHYENKAWDLRARDKTEKQRQDTLTYLRARLGYGWDVILETPADPQKHHFHIERDTRTYPEV